MAAGHRTPGWRAVSDGNSSPVVIHEGDERDARLWEIAEKRKRSGDDTLPGSVGL